MTKKKNIMRITKGERFIYTTAVFCVLCTIVLQVFCGASLGNLNISVEKLKYEIKNQNKQNESLTMKVHELTAFSNVKDIVKNMGLAYNYDNIINVGK